MKLLLTGILSFIAFIASSQDLQTVQRSIASNDYLSAKKQVDILFDKKKISAEAPAWYYKGRVYTEVVRQHDKTDYKTLEEAFKAYKRYQELDPKNKLMQLNNNVDLFQLYDLSYNTAADYYNDKNYSLAYNHFKIALDVEEYIQKKGFSFQGKTFPSLDTSLINLTASAAYLSNKQEEAIPYFERLANAKINNDDYKGVYALLYQHYSQKNDQARAIRYLTSGREIFPDNEYWIKMEMGTTRDEKTKFLRYEQLLQKYPANFELMMDYATELFNYVYAEPQPADFDNRQNRLQLLLTKAVGNDPNSAIANFVMSQHVYSQVYYMEVALKEMKEDTPTDQTKKKNLSSKLDQKYEELLRYSLKAYELYSTDSRPEAKEYSRKALNQLIVYYQKRKQVDKLVYYQEKLKSL
jgi:tetratricopeptide (TPR) repeat protein